MSLHEKPGKGVTEEKSEVKAGPGTEPENEEGGGTDGVWTTHFVLTEEGLALAKRVAAALNSPTQPRGSRDTSGGDDDLWGPEDEDTELL